MIRKNPIWSRLCLKIDLGQVWERVCPRAFLKKKEKTKKLKFDKYGLLTLGSHSLWLIENSGRPDIFELKTLFSNKILFFYKNFNIF